MKPYTVLLLRPDYIAEPYGQDTYLAHVNARIAAEFGVDPRTVATCAYAYLPDVMSEGGAQ